MNGSNTITKEQSLKELDSINKDIENIMKNASNIDEYWDDEVSIGYKKRLDEIEKKKQKLLYEIEKLEKIIKNN